ncbi:MULTISPECIES: hypothetical protein [Candidatus Cardinium]|uniref:hypothetical protein n=1 Tax=Candidatus Cardinium TaxID=273135 RepID=UPI001FAADF94|nr:MULTISPECIES: hypothetical protein [Cardinium]
MVYKEIKNKIPSLSSLLLAGSLFGGGGCKNCDGETKSDATEQKDQPVAPAEAQSAVNDDSKGAEKNDSRIVADPDLASANKHALQVFSTALGLDYLKNSSDLHSLTEKDFSTFFSGNTPEAHVYNLIQNISKDKDKYNPDIIHTLQPLFSLSEKAIAKFKYCCALARFVNEIPLFVEAMGKVYNLLFKEVAAGATQDQLKELKKTCIDNDLLPRLKAFESTTTFHESIAGKLLDGAQLARFFTDKDAKGKEKSEANKNGHSYGVPAILEDKCAVWIKTKTSDKSCKDNTTESLEDLDQRGSGISEDILVQGGHGTKMPKIKKLSNDGLISTFNINNLSNWIKLDHTDPNYNNLNGLIESQVNDDQNGSKCCSDIEFGTLLFTLFRGKINSGSDFLQIDKSNKQTKDNPKVILKSSHANFKNWVEKDSSTFASDLYDHITKDPQLKELFVIPNVDTLYSYILPKSKMNAISNDHSASNAVASANKSNDLEHAESIDPDTPLGIICQGIVDILGLSSISAVEMGKKITRISSLANEANWKLLEASNATFDQLVCIKIADALVKHSKRLVQPGDTKTNFISMTKSGLVAVIEDTIKKQSDFAIVKIAKDGKVANTIVSDAILKNLKNINKKLQKKFDDSSYTIINIDKEVTEKLKGTTDLNSTMNINLHEACKKAVNNLEKLILTDPTSLMIVPNKQIVAQDFPGIYLTAKQVDQINEIKKIYFDRKNKRPGATPVA